MCIYFYVFFSSFDCVLHQKKRPLNPKTWLIYHHPSVLMYQGIWALEVRAQWQYQWLSVSLTITL